MSLVHLAFGSNIRPEANMITALGAVGEIAAVKAVSPVYASAPVGMAGDEFLNAVVALTWPRGVAELADLKDRLTAVEVAQGRRADAGGWSSRTIDLDIILVGDLVARYGTRPWQVPHPDIARFAHVAVPLAAVVSGRHPVTDLGFAAIAAQLRKQAALRPVELAGWSAHAS
jgi:2-amino-4-hydroxy-6-hydroxymethyldihydropteridine diphosphokinase